MFDLIDESGEDLKKFGYKVANVGKYDISVSSLSIKSNKEQEKLKLPKGDYFIVNTPLVKNEIEGQQNFIVSLLQDRLKVLMENLNIQLNNKVLIVGLGNPEVLSDCLGKFVVDEILIDAVNKKNNIYKFCPNVFFSTGINTFDMVAILVQGLGIESVIIIDSLATHALKRLGCSIQLSDAGMTPGSGVNKLGKRICQESIGVPCISIGVPFMIFANDIQNSVPQEDLLLTPKDIHVDIKNVANLISTAINNIFGERSKL